MVFLKLATSDPPPYLGNIPKKQFFLTPSLSNPINPLTLLNPFILVTKSVPDVPRHSGWSIDNIHDKERLVICSNFDLADLS